LCKGDHSKSKPRNSAKNIATNFQIVRNKNAKSAVLQQFGFLKDSNNEVGKKKVGCMI